MLKSILIASAFWVALAGIARAADAPCKLEEVVRLDAKVAGSDYLYLPATFSGRPTRLILSTGSWSELRATLVQALGLKPQRIRTTRFRGVAGDSSKHYVTVPEFQLGNRPFRGIEFLVAAEEDDSPIEQFGGLFGAERLFSYDVEINGATKAVTLYRSDIFCSGPLVRWAETWTEIPYEPTHDIPDLKAEVDGKKITTTLHTGANSTLMSLDVARDRFGLTPSSPGVRPLGNQAVAAGNELALYSYRFKTLNISGLAFNDVDVVLGDFKDVDLALGMREIRQLHLYVAPKRKKIYATRADAGRDPDMNSATD